MVVRCFEIEGSTAQELTSWTFEEFADPNWQRRGHPLHTLDPEFVEVNHVTFAPRWAEALAD
jgi:hypothetical protein